MNTTIIGDMISDLTSFITRKLSNTLMGVWSHNIGGWIKGLVTRALMKKVIFSGREREIKKQWQEFKGKRRLLILESYFFKGRVRKFSHETFYYVEDHAISRWCGLHTYKYKRKHINNLANGARSTGKRTKA